MSRQLRFLLVALALAGTLGCLVLPLPAHDLRNGRGVITEQEQASLAVGTTTRESVLLRFGEPDEIQNNGSVFIYHWTVTTGVWAVAYAGGGDVVKTYLVRMEFGPDARLASLERNSVFGSSDARLQKFDDIQLKIKPQLGKRSAPNPNGLALQVEPIEDRRAVRTRIGVRSSFNTKLGDLHLPEGAERHLREALVGELQFAGFTVCDSKADARVTLRLNKVWLHTENTILYWDILAEIDCDLVLEPASQDSQTVVRTFRVTGKDRTYLYPSVDLMSKVLDGTLDDLLTRIRTDGVWTSLPRSGGPAQSAKP